jgi:hypothetical protein
MWAQEWNSIADLVTPYPAEPSLDVGGRSKPGAGCGEVVKRGERFFTGQASIPPEDVWGARSSRARAIGRSCVTPAHGT